MTRPTPRPAALRPNPLLAAASTPAVSPVSRRGGLPRGRGWALLAWAGWTAVALAQQPNPPAGGAAGNSNGKTPVQQNVNQTPPTIQTLAIVNGEQITRQQIATACLQRHGETVLEGIINRQLVLDECKRQNILITVADVDQEIERRAKKFNMSGARYMQLLQNERKIPPDRLKNEIVWLELALRRLAAQQLQVDPAEVAQALESEYGPRVQVRAIVLDNRDKAEQILATAKADPSQFETLAKDHSIDPNTASFRGMLPPIRRHSGEPEFENTAFNLQVGEISAIIDVADPKDPELHQYVILKCERHYPAAEISSEQRPLIEERLRDEIAEAKLGDAAAALFGQLQSQAQIVNVHNNAELRQQMPGVAATINGTNVTLNYLAEECIARYGQEILETEINRTLITQALRQQNLAVSPEDVQAEIARAAASFGFPDVNQWIQYVTKNDQSQVNVYVDDEVWPSVAMKKMVQAAVTVSDDDMKKGFEANFGERVEALAIVLQDYNTAKKVWKMAIDNPDQKYFGELAFQYSVEPASKANYGQVPPIQKFGGRPTLEDEAFKLQPGEISGLVNVGEFWIVMYCLGRTVPKVQNFDAVKTELYNDILEKKLRIAMDQKFRELRDTAQIDNFLAGTSQSGRTAAAATAPTAETQRK